MSTKYFKISIFLSLIINLITCQAQNLPLNTSILDIPQYAHVKDLNNELATYLGTYKANFQGKEITLYITKEEDKFIDYGTQKFYRDALVVKYIVKNTSGNVLQNTKNINTNIDFFSTKIKSNQSSVIFNYSGSNCGVGWGTIELKKNNSTQISWEYRPNDTIIDSSKCPDGTDINIYLPETKDLIFTKQ